MEVLIKMKQSKRMISVLLALILTFSVFTVGAQALRTSYESPEGYDTVLDPIISTEQAATMVLDFLDADVLAGVGLEYHVLDVDLVIKDVDSVLDSLKSLDDSTWLGIADALANLGDISDLNYNAGKDKNIRRRSASCTDLTVLFKFLQFLKDNARIISKFVDNSFSVGSIIKAFWDPREELAMLNDLHGTITAMVFDLIYGDGASTAPDTTYSNTTPIDTILQDFIDNSLVKMIIDMCASADGTNTVGEFLGFTTYAQAGDNSDLDELGKLRENVHITYLFPSLSDGEGNLGKLSINNDSTYEFFSKILSAAIRDVVMPYAGELLGDLLGDDIAEYIDIVLPVLNLDLEFPPDATAKEKINLLLEYLLVGEGKERFIRFEEVLDAQGNVEASYLVLADGLWEELCGLIRIVLPMLPGFWDDAPKVTKTDAELAAMDNEALVAYTAQIFLEKFVDGVDFATDCVTLKELASRTLIDVAKDLVPSIDFEQQFENGQLVYDSDDCLTVAASIFQYYLNGRTTIENHTTQPGIVDMFNTAVDWLLDKFGALFGYKAENYKNKTVWHKLYDTVFQWIPVTVLYGIEDSPAGIEDLIMNRLLGSILEFDINSLISVVGKRSDSELQKSLPQLIVNLLARVINPLFGLPTERYCKANVVDQTTLVIPYDYTTLDNLITVVNNTNGTLKNTGLKNTAYILLLNIDKLHADTSSLLYQALPLVSQLIGLWDKDLYPFVVQDAPSSYPLTNGNRLKDLYNQYAETANDGKEYDDDDYSYFHMVDFQPFLYLDFRRARNNVGELVELYEASLVNPAVVAPTRTEMTNAAYVLETYARMLNEGYNMDKSESSDPNTYEVFGETTAINYQLNKDLNKAIAANYQQIDNGDGTFTYTQRTWRAYQKAYAFAVKVNNEYLAAASSENPEKELRDLRQSRINTARKQLVKAVKELKAYVPLADYTSLDMSIDVIDYITSLRKFSQDSINDVIDQYKKAINLDRDYDRDDQLIVDHCQQDLDKAIQSFDGNIIDYLELYNDGIEQFVDENNSFLFGLPEGFASQEVMEEVEGDFNTYMISYYGYGASVEEGEYKLEIKSRDIGNGTGSTINMYSYEDEECTNPKGPTYSVVIFGDVDGDAYADGCDAVIIRAYNAMMLNDASFGEVGMYAGDLDVNGYVDVDDARSCEKAGLFKETINQTPEARTSQMYGILDILGLR